MYCPRCSKEFSPETSYCRTCGLSLEGVVQIVQGEAETEPEIRSGPNGTLTRAGIGSFIIGGVIGLSIPIFKNLELFTAASVARYVFLGIVMLSMLMLGAGVVFPQKRYVKKKKRADSTAADKDPRIVTGRLEQLPSSDRNVDDFIMSDTREPDSVTEHTTRRLR